MRAFITLAFCWGLSLLVQAASFDCCQAATLVETRIFQDVELDALDDALADQYPSLLAAQIGDRARQTLKTSPRVWLKRRNRCQGHLCLVTAYRERLCDDYPFSLVSVWAVPRSKARPSLFRSTIECLQPTFAVVQVEEPGCHIEWL